MRSGEQLGSRVKWSHSCSISTTTGTARRLFQPPTQHSRLRLKCDGTRAETRFRLSAKRTSPFKLAGTSVRPTTGSRGVRISGSNVGYTMFRGSAKGTGYPLHSPVSLSLPLSCVTVCHHISTGLYDKCVWRFRHRHSDITSNKGAPFAL